MTTETATALAFGEQAAARKRLITAEEYCKMAEVGILHHDSRVELIEGEIIEMSPVNAPHINCLMNATRLFVLAFEGNAKVSIQSPVSLGEYSEPEPDIAVLKKRRYDEKKPDADDVLLAVEVADSTLIYDRREKSRLYAKYRIPEYWIVNIPDKRLEVQRDPQDDFYKQTLIFTLADRVSPIHFSGATFAVADFFREE